MRERCLEPMFAASALASGRAKGRLSSVVRNAGRGNSREILQVTPQLLAEPGAVQRDGHGGNAAFIELALVFVFVMAFGSGSLQT